MNSVIVAASGGGANFKYAAKTIRFARHGCANRPFYHIVVMMTGRYSKEQPIEQLGTHDPMVNESGELLTSLNLERIHYWLGQGAEVSKPVAELLGLAGYLPVHPHTYLAAWKNLRKPPIPPNPIEKT